MAQVFEPTHYGKVPQKTSAGTTAINDQTQGTITKLVKQPCNEAYPTVDAQGNWRYVEVYKGPTSMLKNLPKTAFIIGKTLSQAHTSAGSSNFIDRFDAPQLPDGLTWVIDSVAVRQNQAGDTSEIKINYTGQSLGAYGTWVDDTENDRWTLQWQPYSVSPYAFCKNDMLPDREVTESGDKDDTADRYNIEMFLKQQKCDLSGFTYIDDKGTTRKLNEAEQLITKKILNNTNCQWHYPVVTKMSAKHTAISVSVEEFPDFPDEVGGVDYIEANIDGCPYVFDKDYQWVKIDDSVNSVKDYSKLYYHRIQRWMGVISADYNYYGATEFDHNNLKNCRWEIGKL